MSFKETADQMKKGKKGKKKSGGFKGKMDSFKAKGKPGKPEDKGEETPFDKFKKGK